jgi:hypothetical protein
MKSLGDWAFSSGVNRIVFHRYQHQPRLDRWPGMTMGPYGVHWERTQTWWDMADAYHACLARCQYMLRQGLPVADVCFLVAEGAPHVFRPPPSAVRGNPPERLGYNFDACSPETLLARMSVKDGRLVLPDGMSYRVLVLPERETMTPKLLGKVKQLVAAGATVVGPPPRRSPSLSGYPECDEEVRRLADELWAAETGVARPEPGERRGGRKHGHIVRSSGPATPSDQYGDFAAVADLLGRLDVPMDFESDGPLRYTHRRAGEADIYFVANREDRPVEATCTFRVSDKRPELWDPVTGEVRDLPQFTVADGRTVVTMRFEPTQSFFVVFRNVAMASVNRNPKRKRGALANASGYDEGQDSNLPAPHETNFPPVRPLAELTGPWQLAFDPRWGGPEQITFDKLEDWSKRREPGIRYYSGTAVYRKTFDLPELKISDLESQICLDLGRVRNLARVRLNGRDLGVVWCAPWQVDITDAVQSRGNKLEIEVANLWPNRLIGDQSLPAEKRLTWTTWNPFTKDSPLLESGLMGPVTIRSRAR